MGVVPTRIPERRKRAKEASELRSKGLFCYSLPIPPLISGKPSHMMCTKCLDFMDPNYVPYMKSPLPEFCAEMADLAWPNGWCCSFPLPEQIWSEQTTEFQHKVPPLEIKLKQLSLLHTLRTSYVNGPLHIRLSQRLPSSSPECAKDSPSCYFPHVPSVPPSGVDGEASNTSISLLFW